MQPSTRVLAGLVLPFLAVATPVANPDPFPAAPTGSPAQSESSFALLALRSGSPIHLGQIEANGGAFWIGKPAATYCPPSAGVCPPGNETVFAVDGDGDASLNVEVPGGQRVFVLSTGNLSFSEPHSAVIPPGAFTSNFSYTPWAANSSCPTCATFGFTTATGGGFLACPAVVANTFPWMIFADLSTLTNADVPSNNLADCLGFDAMAGPYSGSTNAWEYT